jgi:hypothetical protein
MTSEHEGIQLLNAIYSEFPEVADELDKTLKHNWDHEPHERNEMWALLIERFSQLTTDAISRGDEEKAKIYLHFMEKKFLSGGKDCRKAIDVCYVETLLWDIKDLKKKKRGWSLIPKTLQELYIAMWGNPNFKK